MRGSHLAAQGLQASPDPQAPSPLPPSRCPLTSPCCPPCQAPSQARALCVLFVLLRVSVGLSVGAEEPFYSLSLHHRCWLYPVSLTTLHCSRTGLLSTAPAPHHLRRAEHSAETSPSTWQFLPCSPELDQEQETSTGVFYGSQCM